MGLVYMCMCAPCFNLSFENSELNCSNLLHKEFEILTLRSNFFEILKFMFLSKVAQKSFCIKFSGLVYFISKLKILEKSYNVLNSASIQHTDLYIWSLFKAKKNYGVPVKPSE